MSKAAIEPISESDPQRCATGIAGLDDILMGGLPRHHLYLLRGGAGTGKTTLGLQFLLAGRDTGERGLYIALSESESQLEAVAASHGWRLQGIEVLGLAQIEGLIKPEAQTTLLLSAEHELGRTLKVVQDRVDRVRPDRVVIDSLAELRLMAQNPLRFRRQVLALKKAISVVKKRSGGHEETLRELRLIRNVGIEIGEPLVGFTGVTTGVPSFTGGLESILGEADR
jgi:circadian clock protein KaiC